MDLEFVGLIGCRTLSLSPNFVLVFVTQTYLLIFRYISRRAAYLVNVWCILGP